MKNHYASLEMTPTEKTWCACYWVVMLCALPELLQWINAWLPAPLSDGQLNFVYYFINFLSLLWLLHLYLRKSFHTAAKDPFAYLQSVILGFVAYYICFRVITFLITALFPGYINANDAAISTMAGADRFLTALGVIVLVPVTEELIYRGLIFGSLCRNHPTAAYAVSASVFALVHLLGYWGKTSPAFLALSFLQYLPAGIWLAWSCTKSGTIFSSITIHALVNGLAIFYTR